MPDSLPSEILSVWYQCRARRWRLPLWLQGEPAFLQSGWQQLQTQLQAGETIFWLGETGPEVSTAAHTRQISGQARQQLLGQECDWLVINAAHGVDWDLVAASMGCVKAGGLWLVLTPDPVSFARLPNPAASRVLSFPTDAKTHVGHFQAYLTALWPEQPLLSWSVHGLSAAPPQFSRQITDEPPCEPPYASACQQQAVTAIWHLLQGHRHRPLVLSAHRGRGKSAALGIAAAQLQQAGKTRLIITAPQPAAAQVALQTCRAMLGPDIEVQLQFWPLDRLLAEQPAVDLLFVDEAAAIPAPLLQALVEQHSRVVMATTEHGYEGTGRGFQLRFQQYLQQHRPGWRKLILQQPIRYGQDDPLEQLIFNSFLLADSDALAEGPAIAAMSTAPQYHCFQAADLLGQPRLLRQIFRLACLAHYQTSVRDLWALLDDPTLQVMTLQQQELVLAVAVVSREGQLTEELIPQIYNGQRRVQGHLAAQSLIYHCLTPHAGTIAIWRIQRLMVQPALQQQGLGQQLLEQISRAAAAQQVPLLATSFGATKDLVRFWQQAGYRAVKLSQQPEQSSNEFSVLMLKSLITIPLLDIAGLQQWFGQTLYAQAQSVWRELDPELLRLWVRPPHCSWSAFDQHCLQLFLAGQRDCQQALLTLRHWLDQHYLHLSAPEASLWIRFCWQDTARLLATTGLKKLSLQLRQTACLADLYQDPPC
ncbi:MAG: GNAT family N-acetyltransferase [Rheinheimera sp.]|nr:GNAT family N-acetyltransferase [Rheinheimera sp.]